MSGPVVRLAAGVACLAAFAAQLVWLDTLGWYDTWVATVFEGFRGCEPGAAMAGISRASAWAAAVTVAAATAVAIRGGRSRREVIRIVVSLGIALVLAQLLKEVLDRRRPGAAPWKPVGDGFPSGHVANAVLCMGATISLLRAQLLRDRRLRIAVPVAASLFVVLVASTRLYLGRHWLTDVSASVLLGAGYWALVGAAVAVRGTWPARGMCVVGLVAVIGHVPGGHPLPSPVDPHRRTTLDLPLRTVRLLGATLADALDDVLVVDRAVEAVLHFDATASRRAILRVVGRPIRRAGGGCPRLELLLDGRVVGSRPFRGQWRTYGFALPSIEAGPHELRLRASVDARDALAPAVALLRLSVDGATGIVTQVAARRESPPKHHPVGVGRSSLGARPPGFAECRGGESNPYTLAG